MTDTLENAGTAATRSASGLGKVGPAALKWFRESRGISPGTLAQLDVGSGTAFYPELDRKLPSVFFKYSEGWKGRSFPEKHFVASGEKTGGKLKREFWNLDRVIRGKAEQVYLVEGELDACALVEAGIPVSQVLGAHGAKDKPTEGDPRDLPGYAYVKDALEAGLSEVKCFVCCGDADGAGRVLRDDMVKMLGAPRFYFVEWPEGIKDANDMLLKDGPLALCELVEEGSLPWPIYDIYRLSDLPEPAPMTVWRPGFEEWERKVMLAPRTLSVVTGHPGHGKTALWNQIWFNVIKRYDVPFCGATFETRPKPHVRRQLRTLNSFGVRGLLIYWSDYRCSHSIAISADPWPDQVLLSDLEPALRVQGLRQEGLHRKARFEELSYPCKLNLDHDRNKGRYKSVDYDINAPKGARHSESEHCTNDQHKAEFESVSMKPDKL